MAIYELYPAAKEDLENIWLLAIGRSMQQGPSQITGNDAKTKPDNPPSISCKTQSKILSLALNQFVAVFCRQIESIC